MKSKGPAAHPERGETGGQNESEIDPKTTPEMPPKWSLPGLPKMQKKLLYFLVNFTLNGAPKGPRFWLKNDTGNDLKLNTNCTGIQDLHSWAREARLENSIN